MITLAYQLRGGAEVTLSSPVAWQGKTMKLSTVYDEKKQRIAAFRAIRQRRGV